jgi:hypothetical protein
MMLHPIDLLSLNVNGSSWVLQRWELKEVLFVDEDSDYLRLREFWLRVSDCLFFFVSMVMIVMDEKSLKSFRSLP